MAETFRRFQRTIPFYTQRFRFQEKFFKLLFIGDERDWHDLQMP